MNQINEIAPELNEKAIHLKTLFKTVDHLRTLFDKIKQNIDALEAQVEAADRANSSISVKKIFNIFSRVCMFGEVLFKSLILWYRKSTRMKRRITIILLIL